MMFGTKWTLAFASVLLLQQLAYTFIITHEADCENGENDILISKDKCSWLLRFQRNLGKYRNFYASLLQEENANFAVELQELYNTVSTALEEPDLHKMHRLLFYSIWLVERTENLEDYLLSKGIASI